MNGDRMVSNPLEISQFITNIGWIDWGLSQVTQKSIEEIDTTVRVQ